MSVLDLQPPSETQTISEGRSCLLLHIGQVWAELGLDETQIKSSEKKTKLECPNEYN